MAKQTPKELKEQARKLLEKAKRIENESFVILGSYSVKFLNGQISLEEFKAKAKEFGVIENDQ